MDLSNLSKNQKIMAGVAAVVIAYLVYRKMNKTSVIMGSPMPPPMA